MARRAGALAGLVLLLHPAAALDAQRPTVSPRLERALDADTAVAAWLFARAAATLTDVEAAIRTAGGRVRRTSRWLHAVSADLPAAAVVALRSRADLRHLQPVAVFRRPRPTLPLPVARAAPGAQMEFGPSEMPLRRLNMLPLIARGFRGAGVRIALLDTGFETDLPAFAAATVVAQRDFVFDDAVVRDEPEDQPGASQHGSQVWSLLAAEAPDTLVGAAPDAVYLLAKTEDVRQEIRLEEDNFVAALEWADSVGVDVVSSSLVYRTFDDGFSYTFEELNGDVAVTTVAADLAAARGIVVVTAMGNQGPASRTILTPADGDSVLAIGAEDSLGALATFSSRGPTADGRVKPDFTAPGVDVLVLTPQGGTQTFTRVAGTSFATPLMAGAAALLREIHPVIGPIALRDALRRTGTDAGDPDTLRGWGLPDVFLAAVFPDGIAITRPTGGTIREITPRIAWSAGAVPAFAGPATFRLRVAQDTTFQEILVDTVTAATEVVVPPQRPGATFAFDLTATAADSATVVVPAGQVFAVPPWVSLVTLNAAAGLTIRETRPEFTWRAAEVLPPFGSFRFDVVIAREDNGNAVIEARDLADTTFRPATDLEFNTPYQWSVTARLAGDSVTVRSAGPFVIVRDDVPRVTTLFQNFPNPFPNRSIGQTSTCFWFDLATDGVVSLEILDVRGHLVRRLLPNGAIPSFLRAGRYGRPPAGSTNQCDASFRWDGTAGDDGPVPGGLYLAKLTTPDGTFFRRVVFLGGAP